MGFAMNTDTRKTVSQWDAAKFYWKRLSDTSVFHWVAIPLSILVRVLRYLVPAYLISGMLSDAQAGTDVQWQQVLLFSAASMLVGEVLQRLLWRYLHYLQSRAIAGLVAYSFTEIVHKSLAFHSDHFAGETQAKVNRLVDGLEDFSDVWVEEFARFGSAFLFAIYILGSESWWYSLIILIVIAVFMMVMRPVVRKRDAMLERTNKAQTAYSGRLIDSISNIASIKSYARERTESQEFGVLADKWRHEAFRSWEFWSWSVNGLTHIFVTAIMYIPLWLYLSSRGLSDIGQLFIIYYVLDQIANNIWQVNQAWRNVSESLAKAAEGLELLRYPVEVSDVADAHDLDVSAASIEFDNMHYTYAGSKEELYGGLQLQIKPSEKIGLVGPSGGGKSTLAKLVMRFMDVRQGEVRIDGQNIAHVTQESLRRSVSYIPQEPSLFHRSIRDNIAYGMTTVSDKDIRVAAQKAHAHDFIQELPEGYDTLVGERGVKLSGGQRQRIAIARAFLKDAPILILDEATSALDSESEKHIQEALKDLMNNRTVISIAHRLSTLKIMDRLLVIENGEITQQGRHAKLIKSKGTYKDLWDHQVDGMIAE